MLWCCLAQQIFSDDDADGQLEKNTQIEKKCLWTNFSWSNILFIYLDQQCYKIEDGLGIVNFQICNLLNCYERHTHKKLKNIEYPVLTGKKQNFWGWWVIFYFINFEGIWWQTKYNVFWMETRFFLTAVYWSAFEIWYSG